MEMARSKSIIRQESGPTPLDSPCSSIRSRTSSCSRSPAQSTGNQAKLITVESISPPDRNVSSFMRRRLSQPHSQSLDSALVCRSEAYRILEFLHCGSEEMGSNLEYLCKNRIRYIVNLTGVERRKIVAGADCLCGQKAFHSPTEITISVDDFTTSETICSNFPTVNKFIAEARTKGAHVLLYSKDGRNGCQAMALQYIMFYHKMSLDYALRYFRTVYPDGVILSKNFEASLRLWENKLEQTVIETTEKREIHSANLRRQNWASVREGRGGRPMSVDATSVRLAWQ
ncbi:unnamed protein product, partial [Mesorhabditis belari]|uniref:protein-tyrosine-phosphatase n=1 Tax=Mesorhabditis belari TaxID=2138241 RepID=A0AAF3F4Z6_9BILA